MLFGSSFSCDLSHPSQSQTSRPRLQISTLFASPPASPPPQPVADADAVAPISNLVTACRSLQSFILDGGGGGGAAPVTPDRAALAPASSSFASLPTPPLSHAPPPSSMRLRLRKRGSKVDLPKMMRIAKRGPPPLRGLNKRRRALDGDVGRVDESDSDDDSPRLHDSDADSDTELADLGDRGCTTAAAAAGPQTPKRSRIAPEAIPLGLERRDFHDLHVMQASGGDNQLPAPGTSAPVDVEADGSEWSAEDDRILIELVLEKLKLTKTEWQECARTLGKDRLSLGRRWKTLMASADVGLKPTARPGRRARLHSTWR